MRLFWIFLLLASISSNAFATETRTFLQNYRAKVIDSLERSQRLHNNSDDAIRAAANDPEVQPLVEELMEAMSAYSKSVDASLTTGQPRSCFHSGTQITSEQIIKDIEHLPLEWQSRDFKYALAEAMDRRFRCQGSQDMNLNKGLPPPSKVTPADYEINITPKTARRAIAIEISSNKIFFNGAVAGKNVTVLFDNASTWTLIDPSAAERIGLSINSERKTMRIGAGRTSVRRTQPTTFEVAHAFAMRLPLVIFDMSAISKKLGRNVDMVLGSDMLRHVAFAVDAKHRALSILPSGKIVKKPGFAVIPIISDDQIEAVVNGKLVRLQIDFGSDLFVQLSNVAWNRVMPVGQVAAATGDVMSADGSLQRAKVAAARVEIGKMSSSAVPVSSGYVPTDQADGLLGTPLLFLAPVVVDGPAKQLMMVMNPSHTLPRPGAAAASSSSSTGSHDR